MRRALICLLSLAAVIWLASGGISYLYRDGYVALDSRPSWPGTISLYVEGQDYEGGVPFVFSYEGEGGPYDLTILAEAPNGVTSLECRRVRVKNSDGTVVRDVSLEIVCPVREYSFVQGRREGLFQVKVRKCQAALLERVDLLAERTQTVTVDFEGNWVHSNDTRKAVATSRTFRHRFICDINAYVIHWLTRD